MPPNPPVYFSRPTSPTSKTANAQYEVVKCSSRWNDTWALVLFLTHLFIVGGLSIKGFLVLLGVAEQSTAKSALSYLNWGSCVVNICLTVTAALISTLTLLAAKTYPKQCITGSFIANAALTVMLALYCLLQKAVIAGIVLIIMSIVTMGYLSSWGKLIPLSAEILKTVVGILDEYPAMLGVMFGGIVAQACYLLALPLASLSAFTLFINRDISESVLTGIQLFLLFSLYWTLQVINNVALTTVAGVYATCYFSQQRVANPTIKSLGRATTWSFGSICFGSLIVAVIQFLLFLSSQAKDRRDLAGAISECLLKIFERLLKYFNYYAYIHVAIYGKPYLQAGRDSWNLINERGIEPIINDNLVGTFCVMSSMATAAVTALIGYVGSSAFIDRLVIKQPSVFAVCGWVIGFFVSFLMTEIVRSGSTTFMVCLAEDPSALQRSRPDLYELLAAKYSSIFYAWRYP